MVMGLGTGLGGTTIKVKGSGVVGIKVEDTGTIDATVMRLSIVGEGTGSGSKGVEFKGTGGTLMLNMVDVSGFATGVSASKGKLEMMGGSITIKENGGKGYGLNMQGEANAELMRTRIVGDRSGSNSTGVVMGSSKTLMLNSVDISEVKMGVSVEKGMVNMMGGTIMVKENGTGLSVSGTGNATMMGGRIRGTDGKGTGVYMGSSKTLMLNSVDISNVGGSGTGKYGVQMTGEGTMVLMGGSIMG
ncbi:hypothetical protein, partial [Bartonella bovis]|uniref:hypothetical protein n=1 Tax=Bartonella bovis TaxID=155194 RepID=UPI0005514B9F